MRQAAQMTQAISTVNRIRVCPMATRNWAKRSALAFMVGVGCASAAMETVKPETEKDAWEKTLERILSKEGIEVGGVFRSQYLFSSIGGPSTIPSARTEETVEFTSVDFDIKARPNTATQGRIIFRMHQDWRNFFSDISNPIFTRWISIDGQAKQGIFSYHAGDFRRHYSPLTLWSPDLEMAYEPALFARERRAAMDEVFLGNNDRLLQGVELNMDAELYPAFNAVHFNLLGSRLRNVETSVQSGSKPTAYTEASPVEKFLAAANADVTFLKGIDIGLTYLRIFDKKGSYTGAGFADTAAQLTQILGVRAGVETGKLLDISNWSIGLHPEFASSTDDSAWADTAKAIHSASALKGTALKVDLSAEWKMEKTLGIKLVGGYMKNERLYRNELAQSPTFLGERILNIENDTAKVRTNSSTARNYNTLDAMNRTVFKFAPSALTNMWNKAPFSKNSYSRAILTQSEIKTALANRLDSALQLTLPLGPATPNRVGPLFDLTVAGLSDNIQAKLHWASLKNVEGEIGAASAVLPLTQFDELGLGAKVELAGLIGMDKALTFSGYYGKTSADRAALDSVNVHRKAETAQTHAGLYWNFWKRAALLAGWMQFVTDYERGAAKAQVTQSRIAGGLEYKIGPGAYVDGTIGQVNVKRDDAYGDFSQLQTSLDLRVGF